jgi:hypothetical protein
MPPCLSVPMITDSAPSAGLTQIAASSAASPACGIGSVSALAEIVSEMLARAVEHSCAGPSSQTR